MNDRAVVVVSMLLVGIMAALSRQWLGDVKGYVRVATGHAAPVTTPPSAPAPAAGGGGRRS